MNTITKLRKEIEKAIEKDEYGLTYVNGIFCSRSDLETLDCYLAILERGESLSDFFVIGEVAAVLNAYHIEY